MINIAVVVLILFTRSILADCPEPDTDNENVSVTCSSATYTPGTFCITVCDGNSITHTCGEDNQWDIDIDKTDCNCHPLGSSRGGGWTCDPYVPSYSSGVESGTKYDKGTHHAEGHVDPKVLSLLKGYPRACRFRKHQIENRLWLLPLPTFFKT
jgi:hypothetical protein